MNDKKPIPIPLIESPDDEVMAGVRFFRDAGWSLEQILEAYEEFLRKELLELAGADKQELRNELAELLAGVRQRRKNGGAA